MTTMLERAARAAFDAYWAGRDSDPDSQEYWWQNSKENFIAETRAVLMAVRDNAPTRAMAESQARGDEGIFLPLLDLLDFSGENARDMVLRAAWCAAIDAILNDPSQ